MVSFFKKFTIPFCVFITGACVLIIEVTAIRILSSYFGNTIFTVSSVISVVLFALSLGYFFGGKLADTHSEKKYFFGIIVLSGLVITILHILGIIVLPILAYKVSIVIGPIIASCLLFFAQNFFLGMLSPFAIKIQSTQETEKGIGSISGSIFFWSTFGSIIGSLSAGFLLIPHFGINAIILGIGCILICLGLVGLTHISFSKKLFFIVCMGIFTLSVLTLPNIDAKNVLYKKDSLYQKIMVVDGIYEGKPTRFLLQDRNTSAGMRLDNNAMAFEYTKYYKLYMLFNPNIKEALMIGGGAYSVPKALLDELPNAHIDVAEIDPEIYTLGKEYFKVPEDPRLTNITQDGRRFLHDSNNTYDLVFSDAYASFFSTPEHLTTQEFFRLAKGKLNTNGVFIANVIGSLASNRPSFVVSEIKTFKSVFENSYFFAVVSPNADNIQNFIFVGYNSNAKIDFNTKEITKNDNPILSNLAHHLINADTINFSSHPILTDNFSPVDYLISKELQHLQ